MSAKRAYGSGSLTVRREATGRQMGSGSGGWATGA